MNSVTSFLENNLNEFDEYDKCTIELLGGEPFLEFEFIEEIISFLRNNTFRKKVHVFIVTNGTLVHGRIKKWLLQNKDLVSCGLSLDGDKTSQDMNRSNSFDDIDISFFSKTYPKQWVKMTVSEESLPLLYENIIFCHKNNLIVHANLAYGLDWTNGSNKKILDNQLKALIDFYIANPEYEPVSMLTGSININLGNKKKVNRWCGVTTDSMKVLGVDGVVHPCQLLMPMSNGKSIAMESIPKEVPIDKLEIKCKNCDLLDICPTCYAANYINNGNSYVKDLGFCELQKIIIKNRAKYYAHLWDKGSINKTKSEEKLFLSSLLHILKMDL